MKTIELAVRTTADPDSVLACVMRAEQFSAVSPDLILVTPVADDPPERKWIVRFRDNAFWWTERVDHEPWHDRVEFTATGGDFRRLWGSWQAEATFGGTILRFVAQVDLGVPIFDRIVEPLFARVLAGALTDALSELLPDAEVLPTAGATDPERSIAAYVAAL
jgi:hypothetical protein